MLRNTIWSYIFKSWVYFFPFGSLIMKLFSKVQKDVYNIA